MNKKIIRNTIAFIIPALIILIALTVIFSRNKKSDFLKNDKSTTRKPSVPLYRSYPVMGTWAEISLYGNQKTANQAMNKIQDAITKINNVCSRFNPESELSKLNAAASENPFKCSELLWDILIKSKYYYELSDGSFDITITPLMKLWGFYRKQNKIPSVQEIKKSLTLVGLDKVVFNSQDHSVFFKIPGMQIDLGGIAKGYAVDYAYESIIKHNSLKPDPLKLDKKQRSQLVHTAANIKNRPAYVKSGVINLGGNIRFFPAPPPGKKYYSAGIRNPFQKDKLMDITLRLVNRSLATSGDYEKFIILNGKRFTHIINPKTGYPVKDMAAVTIVSHSALFCDALSTSVFINGVKFADRIYKKFPNIDILIIKGYHDKPETVKTFKIGKNW